MTIEPALDTSLSAVKTWTITADVHGLPSTVGVKVNEHMSTHEVMTALQVFLQREVAPPPMPQIEVMGFRPPEGIAPRMTWTPVIKSMSVEGENIAFDNTPLANYIKPGAKIQLNYDLHETVSNP